jgi:hypothetical protein
MLMSPRRRLLLLLTALAVLVAPAIVLRAACAGKSCPEPPAAAQPPPFCGLPEDRRALIAAGFRDTRSPDVLAFEKVATDLEGGPTLGWSMDPEATHVPLVLVGSGVRPGALPEGITLDRLAPTLELIAGLRRPHPDTRTGTALHGVARRGFRPPLLVVIAWKGVGAEGLLRHAGSWPRLRSLLREGISTMDATTGSVPLDPAAVLSTIGSGALPSHHGVTGTLLRAMDGAVAPAWSARAPLPVIAFLGDDLDESAGQRSRIGLVAGAPTDRGLIGGTWYLGHDQDDVLLGGRPAASVADLLHAGYGAHDGAVDLLGVVLDGGVEAMDRATGAIVRLVRERIPDALVAVTSTGEGEATAEVASAEALIAELEREANTPGVVAAAGAAGVFLDPQTAGTGNVSDPVASRALVRGAARLRVDLVAFPGYAVTLRRFC